MANHILKKPEKKEEIVDLWGSELQESNKKKAFRDFKERSTVNVKQVILPQGGHSYNPKLQDHQKILDEVADEE
jgi:hypothetical protein